LNFADNACAALSSGLLPEGGSLVGVVFHAIYADRAELKDPSLAPNQNITVEDLRRFLDLMLRSGYKAVTPRQVDQGLRPGGNYLLVTFDDGYYNNTRALDVLEQFHTPGLFFVSSGHVLQGKAFWWDALARELRQRGAANAIETEMRRMKILDSDQIEHAVRARFGRDALRPRGDLDRPLDARELRDFARHRWVHIGNHTRDHAILPNCVAEEMKRQIEGCQRHLASITGRAPIAIAYPSGDYSREVVDAASAAGLRIGFTARPCTNRLDMESNKARMTLGRYMVWGGEDFALQCRKIKANFIPGHLLKTLMMSAY
jgi:peptidoglycan/xylan/chitin deacetylase (PgdA/CDA1 family)